VGDVHHGEPKRAAEARELAPEDGAQLGIEARPRLVTKKDTRLANQRPGERDPLLLAIGELVRIPIRELRNLDECQYLMDSRRAGRSRRLRGLEDEIQMLSSGQVRPEREVLEDEPDSPLVRWRDTAVRR
jgi:hypothetical protein